MRKVIRSLVINIENIWLFDRKFSVGLQSVIPLCVIYRNLAQNPLVIILIMILIMIRIIIRMISNGGSSMRLKKTEFKRAYTEDSKHTVVTFVKPFKLGSRRHNPYIQKTGRRDR